MLQKLVVDSLLSFDNCHFLDYFLGLERLGKVSLAKLESLSTKYFKYKNSRSPKA
jgi:hypothetical protein